jgi:hypothetical protein
MKKKIFSFLTISVLNIILVTVDNIKDKKEIFSMKKFLLFKYL